MTTNNVFMFTKATHDGNKRVAMTPTVEFSSQVADLNDLFFLKFNEADFELLVVQMYNRRINGNINGHHKGFSDRMIEFNYKKGRFEFLKADAVANGIELTNDVTAQLCKVVRDTPESAWVAWADQLFKLRWGHVA